MITFHSIKYKNFMSTGNVSIEIVLDKSPVTVCSGKNGGGKSSGIIDAIYFALYGKAYRKLTKDKMVNSINQKNLVVELELSVESKQYKIIRGIKPNIFDIYINGKLKEHPASIKDYQLWLEDSILKMNAVTMRQLVFLGSTSFIPFMRLNPGDRRKVVEEILDIQVFSTMNNILKSKASLLGKRYSDVQNSLTLLSTNIELKQKHLDALAKKVEEQEDANQEKISVMLRQIQNIEEENEELLNAIDECLVSITDSTKTQKNKVELDSLTQTMEKRIKNASKEICFFDTNSSCPTCKQGISEESKAEATDRNKESIEKCQSALDLAAEHIFKFQKRLDEIESVENEIAKKRLNTVTNKARISSIQEHIEKLMSDDTNKESADDDKTKLTDEISGHKLESDTLMKERTDISDQSQYFQVVTSLLKDSGIKSTIINNYLPTINSLIRKYLEILEFPCEFTFDENFNETMKSRYRDTFSYANFSEGQKLRIDLSLLFAWRELSRLRNSATCNLLVLDEIGSSSLDTEGTEAFMRIINETSADSNVFIISHDKSVSDTNMRTLEFSIEDNFTKMEESS